MLFLPCSLSPKVDVSASIRRRLRNLRESTEKKSSLLASSRRAAMTPRFRFEPVVGLAAPADGSSASSLLPSNFCSAESAGDVRL